jgi:Protein of unknown function (DUF2398)
VTGTQTRSASTAEHDATEQRAGARALPACPILTAGRNPEALALVRRHARALKAMFASTVDYQLVVESTFARLHKGPLDPEAAPGQRAAPTPAATSRPARTPTWRCCALGCSPPHRATRS